MGASLIIIRKSVEIFPWTTLKRGLPTLYSRFFLAYILNYGCISSPPLFRGAAFQRVLFLSLVWISFNLLLSSGFSHPSVRHGLHVLANLFSHILKSVYFF